MHDEPAFAWWVPYALKKQQWILQKVKTKYWSRTHKYGICISKSIKEVLEIDREAGNTMWMDAIKLEMKNVRVAFEEFDGDPRTLIRYTQITGKLVSTSSLAKTSGERPCIVLTTTKQVHLPRSPMAPSFPGIPFGFSSQSQH
jgi:hypothetical protein